MTRDELIAKVYEKCGLRAYAENDQWAVRHPDGGGYWVAYIGLDEFVSDIVPVLNERGWSVSLPWQFVATGEWFAKCSPIHADQNWSKQSGGDDPIEAAFAVALEVLGE